METHQNDGGGGGEQNNRGQCEEDMSDLANPDGCYSPIILAERGQRIALTSADDGVNFDLDSDGVAERLAWTRPGSTAAFLALDRNGNGTIDNGGELFGNFSPQPASASPNGFLALEAFDDWAEGGNGDGWITEADWIYAQLLLWTDANHDGISQPDELRGLGEQEYIGLSLSYRESRRVDGHGNWFRYIGEAFHRGPGNRPVRKFMVDVFFATG